MAMMTEFAIVFAAANTALLLSLLYIYLQSYHQLKSSFALGLILFAAFLLLENVVALYFNVTMMGLYADSVAFQVLVLRMIETAALIVLTFITWRH